MKTSKADRTMNAIASLLCHAITATLLIVLAACAPDRRVAINAGPEAEIGQVQVLAFAPDTATRDALIRAATVRGYRGLAETELPALGLTMLSLETPQGVTGAAAIETLEAIVPASTVGLNHKYRIQAVSSTDARRRNYASALMSWPAGGCSATVPIGLIDTAVDTASVVLSRARIVSERFTDTPSPDMRHGTEMAAVLADPSRLQNVTIYSASVVATTPEGDTVANTDALIRALDWMTGLNVPLVNIALAGPYNKLLEQAVDAATSQGLTLVAAVGNAGPDVDPLYPAAFETVVAVTAVDAERRLFRNAVRGTHVDVAAPGVDIFVSNGSQARFVTGTSIATSFVTAWLAANPSFTTGTNIQLARQRLLSSSEDLGASGPDPLFGVGLLNAEGLCAAGAG
ncbi:MAG: S8 family serine peptidase [Pseudomonadota bacterium]